MSTASPVPLVIVRRRFGETARRDAWWIQPLVVFLGLSTFVVYATWAAFQGDHYTYGPYLSPFYSPELFGSSPHSWFGPKPAAWPEWLPFSPALLILPIPGLFRFTCYYYRGAYYKAFWSDPPSCTVGEPRKSYWGENSFPLVTAERSPLHAVHLGVRVDHPCLRRVEGDVVRRRRAGEVTFGIGVGTLILLANVVLLGGYLFGCHSMRHVVGGLRRSALARAARPLCPTTASAASIAGTWSGPGPASSASASRISTSGCARWACGRTSGFCNAGVSDTRT